MEAHLHSCYQYYLRKEEEVSSTFFVSDTHFGHVNILKYEPEKRPFSSIEEHDEELIKRWNSVVKPADRVYHLGDVAINRRCLSTVARCNGRKKLIRGNHDLWSLKDYLPYFDDILSMRFFANLFIASHFPIHPSHMRVKFNIHGHLHSNKVQMVHPYKKHETIDDPRYMNVSVEHTNLTPVSIDDVLKELKEREME